jgi:hypothetical protein
MTGKAKASYTTDNDLLPKGHPWKKRGLSGKSVFVDGVEHFAEPIYQGNVERNNSQVFITRYVSFVLPEDSQEKSE